MRKFLPSTLATNRNRKLTVQSLKTPKQANYQLGFVVYDKLNRILHLGIRVYSTKRCAIRQNQ
ncbi:hypothetical protein Hanom_Chr16g01431711 [Helianthus anomalus]